MDFDEWQKLNAHAGAAVKVKGLKGDVIFECVGPRLCDCSVLVLDEARGKRRRVMARLADVTFMAQASAPVE